MGNIQRPDYNASGDTNQWVLDVNRDWMRRIPDHRRLADISMPGTHNSCAGHGVVWVKCQSKCIIHQLRLGIRFLDIRCNNFTEGEHMYTGFGIFHGKFYQHISFGDVLRSINEFFAEQPGEAVIMRIRTAEHPGKPTPDDLAQRIFNIYRGQYPNLFYYGNINVGGTTLGQVRGRIVVLQHIQLGNFTDWNGCHVEDEFEAMGEEKKASIRRGFDHIASNANNHLTITFSSSCGGIPFYDPSKHAKEGLNRFVFNSVEAFKRQGRGVGIVAMDYPGDELIRDIINLNFITYIVNPASN
jgi:1-phosphatidylinositol phosphodiesterase